MGTFKIFLDMYDCYIKENCITGNRLFTIRPQLLFRQPRVCPGAARVGELAILIHFPEGLHEAPMGGAPRGGNRHKATISRQIKTGAVV